MEQERVDVEADDDTNYPDQGTRVIPRDLMPSRPRDFGLDAAASAVDAANAEGGGFTDLYNPRPYLPRTAHGPALQWDNRVMTAAAGDPGIDTDVSFPVSVYIIDNYTSQFVYISAADRFVPPYTFHVVMPCMENSERVRVQWLAPPGIVQGAVNAGQIVKLVVLERDDVAPSPGVSLKLPTLP